MKKQFVGLCRVALRNAARLDDQERRIRDFAKREGYDLTKVHRIVEGAGPGSSRPLFWDAIEEVKASAHNLNGIIVCGIDRLARDLRDVVALLDLAEQAKLSIESVDGVTFGEPRIVKFSLAVMEAMSGLMSQRNAERARKGTERRVRAGLLVGRAPYGYDNVRVNRHSTTQTNVREANVVRRVYELVADGECDLNGLPHVLLSKGIRRANNAPRFDRRQLQAILRNRTYVGEVRYKDQWHPGTHEPIVDRVLFDLVQTVLGEAGW